jgi:formyltetrahydrofolate deformylase
MTTNSAEQLITLLVSCPDRRGIVAGLAQLLAGHGVNILDSDQHTDREEGQFFQRIRCDLAEMATDRGTLTRALEEVAERFSMKMRVAEANHKKRVAIFVSKYDHCLYDLLLRHRSGELNCDLALIISNHPDLAATAKHFGIDYHLVPKSRDTKAAQEAVELELLAKYQIDLVVLARYMQILSDDFVAQHQHRIINIHHSFLPAFVGSKPYHRAHERGVKLIGATAHYATATLDEGPIIEQGVTRCTHRDDVPDLIRKGRDLEKFVLAQAIRWHLEDRVLVYGNKTVIFE